MPTLARRLRIVVGRESGPPQSCNTLRPSVGPGVVDDVESSISGGASGCEVNDFAAGVVDEEAAGVTVRLGGAFGSGVRACETGRDAVGIGAAACNSTGFDDALAGPSAAGSEAVNIGADARGSSGFDNALTGTSAASRPDIR